MPTLSLSKRSSSSSGSLLTLSCVFAAISLLIKLVGTLWIKKQLAHLSVQRDYSYVGNDYPEEWPIERKMVAMQFDNPKHFALETEDGAAEWAAISPGHGVVHLGPHKQPYTVGMMHQLKCLDIIRQDMVRDHSTSEPSEMGRHCLNYMRQMIMCRGDLELESFQFASHKNPINWRGVYECKDWEALFNAVKENQEEHSRWLAASGKVEL
ncbi:hypothetical protein CVT24_000920 [Panaeolus cyanescens]|uniref:Uncharacterized protein n=1 Tax=Panaeolus cyanescens TaxID=181874 RepID=A0A409YTG5_9AGAR|nr:hypothetical protein CVT24_000920 [Panaeolus cyanescens]